MDNKKRKRSKRNDMIGRCKETVVNHSRQKGLNLSVMNEVVDSLWDIRYKDLGSSIDKIEFPLPCLPNDLWEDWLWGSDPTDVCKIDCLLNRSHLIGLILARYRAIYQHGFYSDRTLIDYQCNGLEGSIPTNVSNDFKTLCLYPDRPVSSYTLRELRDTIQNIQVHWVDRDAPGVCNICIVLDSLFHRFGVLASLPQTIDVMNDQGSIDDFRSIGLDKASSSSSFPHGMFVMNSICIRRFCNLFLVLYRHLSIRDNCCRIDPTDVKDSGINIHHVVASGDDFGRVSMNWDLMPSSKLNYMHDFPGMYNCVSQVVYFHNPKYETRLQERIDIVSISSGMIDPVHTVPCIMQIHPEIGIVFEEDDFSRLDGYNWLLLGKRVYLVSPDGCAYYHENIIALMWLYRSMVGIV